MPSTRSVAASRHTRPRRSNFCSALALALRSPRNRRDSARLACESSTRFFTLAMSRWSSQASGFRDSPPRPPSQLDRGIGDVRSQQDHRQVGMALANAPEERRAFGARGGVRSEVHVPWITTSTSLRASVSESLVRRGRGDHVDVVQRGSTSRRHRDRRLSSMTVPRAWAYSMRSDCASLQPAWDARRRAVRQDP